MAEVKDMPAGNEEPPAKRTKLDVESNDSESNSTPETNNTTPVVIDAELSNKIKKQIEYYFGDNNMRRDKFLLEQTKLDNGWVPMTVLLTFKILAALSKDAETVLKSIEDSELVEISEDRKKIRRSPDKPLPTYDDEYLKAQEARTLYLKGFSQSATMDDLKEFFEPYDVENIIMRRYTKDKQKFFKGSIFVQFKTLENAKSFFEKESVKYKDTELIKKWAKDYNTEKEKEKEERQAKKLKNIINEGTNGKNKNDKEEPKKKNFLKGCVLQISEIPTDLTRDYIKEKVSELKEVAYIDLKAGQTEGWIRFAGENSAVELIGELKDNKIKFDDKEIQCKLLEGEEEDAYFVKVQQDMNTHKANRQQFKGRKGRKNFKRRGNGNREDDNAKRLRSS